MVWIDESGRSEKKALGTQPLEVNDSLTTQMYDSPPADVVRPRFYGPKEKNYIRRAPRLSVRTSQHKCILTLVTTNT